MAQKRIKRAQTDILANKVRLLYDDGTQGVLDMEKFPRSFTRIENLIGLTLKQAKLLVGIKN